MTTHDRDKIIAAAKEAGFAEWENTDSPEFLALIAEFYAIAFENGRQAEREECLNICINHASDYAVFNCEPYESMEQGALSCALTIRARGDTK